MQYFLLAYVWINIAKLTENFGFNQINFVEYAENQTLREYFILPYLISLKKNQATT